MNSFVQPDIKVIKKRNEIKSILQSGRRIKTRFGVFYLMKGEPDAKRMAVLIKKQIGNSVKRNYCKRIVREYIRRSFALFAPYHDIIFLYNRQGSVSYWDVFEDFSDRITAK